MAEPEKQAPPPASPYNNAGYAGPPPGQPGYPPQGQPGYPPPQGQQPGYGTVPPQGQPYGYPPAGQPGYPPPGQPGYPPAGQYGNPGYAMQPVVAQPTYGQPGMAAPAPQQQWMQAPPPPPGCPPGLEYLALIDQLIVKQKVELLEAFTGFETNNKYAITNSVGQQVYFAAEQTDCCTRQCCGPSRPFDIKIVDNAEREVLHLSRPLRCAGCCFPCCLQELEVQSPPGTVIGYVEQNWSLCAPKFSILNAEREVQLTIEGPICTFNMCGDVEFKVLSLEGEEQVGRISKQWTGMVQEMFTDADTFGITFPMDLDVKVKAVMVGACFLIDFMFFEQSQNQDNQRMTING